MRIPQRLPPQQPPLLLVPRLGRHLLHPRPVQEQSLGPAPKRRRGGGAQRGVDQVLGRERHGAQGAVAVEPRDQRPDDADDEEGHEDADEPGPAAGDVGRDGARVQAEDADVCEGRVGVQAALELASMVL